MKVSEIKHNEMSKELKNTSVKDDFHFNMYKSEETKSASIKS